MEDHDGLVGMVLPPADNIMRRPFKTLEALTDYIRTFKITHGGFGYGEFAGFGVCYMLEYPVRQE